MSINSMDTFSTGFPSSSSTKPCMSNDSVDLNIDEFSSPDGFPCRMRVPESIPINAPIIIRADAILLLLSPSDNPKSDKSKISSSSFLET